MPMWGGSPRHLGSHDVVVVATITTALVITSVVTGVCGAAPEPMNAEQMADFWTTQSTAPLPYSLLSRGYNTSQERQVPVAATSAAALPVTAPTTLQHCVGLYPTQQSLIEAVSRRDVITLVLVGAVWDTRFKILIRRNYWNILANHTAACNNNALHHHSGGSGDDDDDASSSSQLPEVEVGVYLYTGYRGPGAIPESLQLGQYGYTLGSYGIFAFRDGRRLHHVDDDGNPIELRDLVNYDQFNALEQDECCLLYTSPSPRDRG